MKPIDALPLSTIEAGQTVMLVGILASRRSGQRLAELGLTPRTPITVLQSMPGQPLLIRVRGSRLALDRTIADQLRVQVIDVPGRRERRGRFFHRHRRKGRGRRRNALGFLSDRMKRRWRRRPHFRKRSRK
jgi:Fe2+ transport system protein FeoA